MRKNFRTLLYLLFTIIFAACNSNKEKTMEGNNDSVNEQSPEITEEQLDHLGITDRNHLSAASKRALQWPRDLGNEWFIEFSKARSQCHDQGRR